VRSSISSGSCLPRKSRTCGGSNSGSNFEVYRYADSGSYIGTAFSINRATGNAAFSNNLSAAGSITSSGGSIGYAAGAGGAVTQANSKSTDVILSKAAGRITTHAEPLAAGAAVSFTVTNSAVAAADTINLNLAGGNAVAGSYRYWVDKVSAGSFAIAIENRSGGSLAEALNFNFAVVKAVAA
jgi:hypothetical protein